MKTLAYKNVWERSHNITFLGTDSFAKLNIQSELLLSPTAPMPIQHVESGKLPPT